MPSKFFISDERVGTDAAARAAVDAALKVPENRPLCEEMLCYANEREATDEKQYTTRMWRRAAIVLAEAPINFFSEDGERMLWNEPIRMPDYETTARAYRIVVGERMKRKYAANPMIAFPPEWRDGMLEDERLQTALRVAGAIVAGRYVLIDTNEPHTAIAYGYYIHHTHPELKIMIGVMERMAGV